MSSFYSLNDAGKETWLVQHVPHRICAALALLPIEGKWAMPKPPVLPGGDFHVWCIGRSVDEGRKAAMRWLIEFVGVTLGKKDGKNESAVAPKAYSNGKSVTIREVGGTMFDTNLPDAFKLAKIWQACTQASLHPTMDTKHDPLGEKDLASALQIVLDHLETALYQRNGRDLGKIVREQEELAIRREAQTNSQQSIMADVIRLTGEPVKAPKTKTKRRQASTL